MPIGAVNSYSDIDMDMGYHPLTKDLRKKTKEDSIKQSVRNLLLTSPGEKLFNPGWGCNLRGFLFEPITEMAVIEIKESVELSLKNENKLSLVSGNSKFNLLCIPSDNFPLSDEDIKQKSFDVSWGKYYTIFHLIHFQLDHQHRVLGREEYPMILLSACPQFL